jgi:hypothetical protein
MFLGLLPLPVGVPTKASSHAPEMEGGTGSFRVRGGKNPVSLMRTELSRSSGTRSRNTNRNLTNDVFTDEPKTMDHPKMMRQSGIL